MHDASVPLLELIDVTLSFPGVRALLVVLLNIAGILTHAAIAKWRRVIIFCSFLIAAIITPAEPISMLALAVPLVVLFELAELFCFLNDRRRRRHDPTAELSDDEVSELDDTPSELDESPSPLEDLEEADRRGIGQQARRAREDPVEVRRDDVASLVGQRVL